MKVSIKLDKIALKLKARYGTIPHAELDEEILLKARKEGWEVKERYESTRINTYKYVWLLQEKGAEEGKIYLGIWYNGIKAENPKESARRIKVEYNPQKTRIPIFLKVYFQNFGVKCESIQSCDIAFDIEGIRADEVRYKTRGDIMTYGNAKDKSIYIRPSAKEGRIKIYDKTRERERAGKPIDKQITRVEITLHEPDFWEASEIREKDLERLGRIVDWLAEIAIPTDFHTRMDILEEKYGRYDPAMLTALKALDQEKQNEVLNLMSKQARAKYRAALLDGDYQVLSIDILTFWMTVSEYLRRCVAYEDIREAAKPYDSPHIHPILMNENEIENTISKPKIIKQ